MNGIAWIEISKPGSVDAAQYAQLIEAVSPAIVVQVFCYLFW